MDDEVNKKLADSHTDEMFGGIEVDIAEEKEFQKKWEYNLSRYAKFSNRTGCCKCCGRPLDEDDKVLNVETLLFICRSCDYNLIMGKI